MILNIDLGTLYVKISVIEPRSRRLVTAEVVRMEKSTISVIEVLLTSIIENYSRRFDIRVVHIIPNTKYVDCEIIDYESVTVDRYDKILKEEVGRTLKEEKKKKRLGAEYTPPKDEGLKLKHTPIKFNKELSEVELFHQIEHRSLMSSKIYVEYIDRDYLKSLGSVIKGIEKEILIISPIRAMKYYPLPKENRIILNYGHRTILTGVIESNPNGQEYFREVKKETVQDTVFESVDILTDKHEKLSLDRDTVYEMKMRDIRKLKEKYPGYPVYIVGGNSTYLHNDLMTSNSLDMTFHTLEVPEVLENLLLPSYIFEYRDFPYNSIQMQMKNKVLSAMNMSNQVARAITEVSGDLAVAILVICLVSSYYVTSNYQEHKNILEGVTREITFYEGPEGKIAVLEKQIEALKTGRSKNYYNISELLDTLSSPIEMESIVVDGKNLHIVAYADNVALVRQFLETVRTRQSFNDYTKFNLNEVDVTTVYRDGRKMDRVEFQGRLY